MPKIHFWDISVKIKKKLTTAAGLFRIQWRCKDREHCRTTVRLLSLRENLLVQADYNIQSLGIEHSALCNVNATSIIIKQLKKDQQQFLTSF